MHSNQNDIANIKSKLKDSLKVIKMYEWLLDSYVLVRKTTTSVEQFSEMFLN